MFVGVADPARDPGLLSNIPLISSWGEVVLGHGGRGGGRGVVFGLA